MLEIRPNCEWCDKDLPPDAAEARICSYECTFCADCVDAVLFNVCPNCGGGFAPRPIRPKAPRRAGICILNQKPSEKRVHSKFTREEIDAFCADVRCVAPQER